MKLIENQVIAITSASSGIGLATAKLAAKRGAMVVQVFHVLAREMPLLSQGMRELVKWAQSLLKQTFSPGWMSSLGLTLPNEFQVE